MKLIDMHAHSSGISECCQLPYDKIIDTALENGMDGIVLTNHYQSAYLKNNDAHELAERYISEYYKAKEYGDKKGALVLFGIEVTMEKHGGVHLLVYGIAPEFLREYPMLYAMEQKELYSLIKANGGVISQAHPYRNGVDRLLDTAYLDGVEINCHPLYKKSYAGEMIDIAKKNGLFLTCGADFHADTYRAKCGLYIPDEITDHFGLRDYLINKKKKKFFIHEPEDNSCREEEL